MSWTLEELKLRLKEELDEVTLLELLELTSEDIVEAFSDKIEENYDKIISKVGEQEEWEDDESTD